jgi:hypothetical protein
MIIKERNHLKPQNFLLNQKSIIRKQQRVITKVRKLKRHQLEKNGKVSSIVLSQLCFSPFPSSL